MKVILTRHGETEENKNNICQGWMPGHLTGKGIKQAGLLAEHLKDIEINIIYSSDLKRCIDTARIIAKHHPNAKSVEEPLLRERNCGVFEGIKHSEQAWRSLPGDFFTNKPEGGESFEEMWQRLQKFYNKLLKHANNETILIVAHGGSTIMLQGLILKKDLKCALTKIKMLNNTSFSEFEIDADGHHRIIKLNCDEHLGE